jgi:hypothetical protein
MMATDEDHILLVRLEERQKILEKQLDELKDQIRMDNAETKASLALLTKDMTEIHDVFSKWKFAAVIVLIIGSMVGGTIAAVSHVADLFRR